MAKKVLHIKSNALDNGLPKKPTAEQISYGELAINYLADNEIITLKNSKDEIVTFISEKAIKARYDSLLPVDLEVLYTIGAPGNYQIYNSTIQSEIERIEINGEYIPFEKFNNGVYNFTEEDEYVVRYTLKHDYIPTAMFAENGNFNKIIIGDKIKKIEYHAFLSCTLLRDLTIGKNVETIGASAFANCTNLHEVVIPDSVATISTGAFSGCTNLGTLTIGKGLSTLGTGAEGDHAFANCPITTLNINCHAIPENMFKDNKRLKELVMGDNVTVIGASAFEGCISLSTFKDNKSVLEINENIKEIGAGAFYGCTSITELHITSDGELNQDVGLFENCTKLKKLTISGKLTEISDEAYPLFDTVVIDVPTTPIKLQYVCQNATTIELTDNVREIGESAFEGCSKLSAITIPDSVRRINKAAFKGCVLLMNVNGMKNVEYIGESAFENCGRLNVTSTILNDNIKTIGKAAFKGGARVNSIVIPRGITQIPQECFMNCDINQVDMTGNINLIGKDAFKGCRLQAVDIFSLYPPTLENKTVFEPDTPVYVVNGISVSLSEQDGWQNAIVESSLSMPYPY